MSEAKLLLIAEHIISHHITVDAVGEWLSCDGAARSQTDMRWRTDYDATTGRHCMTSITPHTYMYSRYIVTQTYNSGRPGGSVAYCSLSVTLTCRKDWHYMYVSVIFSGGASAGKEPGHFEVRTSSTQVIRMHFFLH